ncbi:MAG: bifunctional heptose 7-phosphate kinase/heptose 1-phosphate adenyltransferase [Nitrospinota bacterium]
MHEIRDLLDRFPESRVLVVGDLMADKYIWTDALPAQGVNPSVLKASREDYALGGAANVAHNLNDFGAEVFLCGLVGYDDAAHWFRRGCNEAGIETSGVFPVNDRPTTTKVRVMSADGSAPLFRIDYEVTDPPAETEMASMRTYIEHCMSLVDAIVLSDYDKGIFGHASFAREILDKAREMGKITVVESKAHLYEECHGARLVILDDAQAETYFLQETGSVPMGMEDTGRRVREALGCEVLAVLRADRELWIHYREGDAPRCTVAAVDEDKVLDATGVKDTVTGTLALGLVAGADIEQAARLTVRAAEAVVQKVGTATVKLEELRRIV